LKKVREENREIQASTGLVSTTCCAKMEKKRIGKGGGISVEEKKERESYTTLKPVKGNNL